MGAFRPDNSCPQEGSLGSGSPPSTMAMAQLPATSSGQSIDERHHLEVEDRLSASNAALLQRWAEEARSRSSALHDAVTGLANLALSTTDCAQT